MKNEMTDRSYWESNYENASGSTELPNLDDFRQLPLRRIVELIESAGIAGKRILEIGAGNSTVIALLAQRNPNGLRFSGLDYTEKGCQSLRNMARSHALPITVIQADLFLPDTQMLGQFDLVYSVGVVEHFRDLEKVTSALRRYLSPGGIVITTIPNMRGLIGTLTRMMNRAIYDLHNPHSLRALADGHITVGLDIVESGYLCSTNFGVLSSCVTPKMRIAWKIYTLLSRLSKSLWYLENRSTDFFHSQLTSPYVYVVAKNNHP